MGIIETAEATTTCGLDYLGDEHLVICRPSGSPVYTPACAKGPYGKDVGSQLAPSGDGFTQPP